MQLRRTWITRSAAVLGPVLFAVAAVHAQFGYGPPGPPPGYNHEGVQRPLVWVLSEIHQVNQDEIRVGHLALERARSPQARDYAQRLIDDHRRNDEELMTLAQQRGIQLIYPRPFNDLARRAADDSRMASDQLQGAYGRQFDQLFAQSMHQGHEDVIQLLTNFLPRVDDPQIRDFVERTLSTLRVHRHLAEELERHQGMPVGGPQ